MKEFETGLHQIHAEARAAKCGDEGAERMDTGDVPAVDESKAFVRVDRVDADSPASAAVCCHFILTLGSQVSSHY